MPFIHHTCAYWIKDRRQSFEVKAVLHKQQKVWILVIYIFKTQKCMCVHLFQLPISSPSPIFRRMPPRFLLHLGGITTYPNHFYTLETDNKLIKHYVVIEMVCVLIYSKNIFFKCLFFPPVRSFGCWCCTWNCSSCADLPGHSSFPMWYL